MNKKTPIIAVLVILLAVGSFFLIKKKSNVSNNKIQIGSSSPTTLKEIFGLGMSQKCTYEGGVIYVSDGKMRGDFTSTDGDTETKGHMIVDGTTSYIWTDGQDVGYKTTFDLDDVSSSDSEDYSDSSEVNPIQPTGYVCEGWKVDSKVFVLPTNITFKDFESLIPSAVPVENTTETTDQCSYCNALSGDQKAQCLSAMNCE